MASSGRTIYTQHHVSMLVSGKATLSEYVQRYVNDFQKPFYVGEYGFINFTDGIISHDFPNWKQVL